ncbi:uncharacterized protein TrAtP1_010733 [Trichoderma atroviride]|uniref:Uncharacterized protein n=1 Tax=Hypocrea atroviridis (strain ATCC 20476 / IMI 206040) TaxID=452589 RepID=G9NI89_HYPAI|nr:uncharacterized protein TRIATDRAFT_92550 [Trichoderma atroviride IMI 206040]EHK49502.1 hypothetical protein TRIATDRAFT_92550 [Trichoderma atroviride IMI 206040]UKZ69729.1 hypothetical protein TrAtP1_010733 [Trichoderma atroviride]
MEEMRRICRTAASSRTHRRVYICIIHRRLSSYCEVRQIFSDYAIPSLRVYLLPEIACLLPAPPSDWGLDHDPFQPVDTAFFHATMSPWNRLFISQFMDYAETKMLAGIPLPLIFAAPATKYEAWKMDKEYKDLCNASAILAQSVEHIRYKSSLRKPAAAHGLKRRAQRLRSRGFGSGLGEVISVDEEWPEEGWASSMLMPDAPYDTRLRYKMRDRPFLLDNDPTDCSGIIPRSRVSRMLEQN